MQALDIAAVAHEVNRAYCEALGDHSHKPWAAAPDWQRQSAVKGVRFHLANPQAGPAASHENWRRVKELNGWGYGPIKDEDRKLHPCCVPFEKLPLEQQVKDHLFRAVVHACALVGLPEQERATPAGPDPLQHSLDLQSA